MGRITIFSISSCPFCRRAKAALDARSIPYTDINIESHPSRRSDMIALSDRLTVPQNFFNEEHVGGGEELLDLLGKWDEDIASANDESCVDKTPYDRYVRLVQSKPDPTDERLAIPRGDGAALVPYDLTASRISEIFEIGDKTYTTLELSKLLMQKMPCDALTYWGSVYYNVFKGSSGVTALQQIFDIQSREEAIQLGTMLQTKQYMNHVTGDHKFGDNGYYFRLQPFHEPSVLNSFHVWSHDPANDSPMYVIHRLGKLWSKLESNHLNENGLVDHAKLREDELYLIFQLDVCELQHISLKDMDAKTKMAFVMNLYNLIIKYAFCKLGVPATNSNRAAFFDGVSVNLGGSIYSFNDLEHGILRGNIRHPYQLSKPFGPRDARREFALKECDPRLHFALNCGAKSCPPVKKYNPEAIEEELRLSAMAFCDQDDNVAIDEENCQLHLSKILYWYMTDFVPSKDDLPRKIEQYLRGERKKQLKRMTQKGRVAVKFLDYDWSSNNDINSLTFKKIDLSSKSNILYHHK